MIAPLSFAEPQPNFPTVWSPFEGFQQRALAASADELLIGGAKGPGKGLGVQTPIPTAAGWCLMGDLRVGDAVFDERGQPCRVVFASDPVSRPCYRLTFDDGSVLIADDVHRWSVLLQQARAAQGRKTEAFRSKRRGSRPSRAPDSRSPWLADRNARLAAERRELLPIADAWDGARMFDTSTLVEMLAAQPFTNPAIPCALALQTMAAPLPIAPYVLGAWLGDGTSAAGSITCDDRYLWVVDQIRAAGYTIYRTKTKNHYSMPGVQRLLRVLGVFRNKHIPMLYLRASVAQRRQLLAGIIDTDGHIDKVGGVEISTVRPQLADGYFELAASLGYKPSMRSKIAKSQRGTRVQTWMVSWTARHDTPVTDPKKAARLRTDSSPRSTRRFLVRIEPCASELTRCIAVDSPSHLYLAGAAMIPTHNTDLLLVKPLRWAHKALYACAFLRESFRELLRPLDRAHELYGALAADRRPKWSGEKQRFTFPSGAFIQFGYAARLRDLTWTQGGNWADICYDEIGNQPDERVVDTLVSELRCKDPSISRQLCGSANPGFAGHPWIMRRYIRPCGVQGEKIAFKRVKLPNGTTEIRSIQFVPGRVSDNPIYANDAAYMAALMLLPERMKRCLLDGDWTAATGMALDELDERSHLVKPFTCPDHWPWISSFDWGYSHPAVFMYGRVSDDGRVFIHETIQRRLLRDWDLAATYNALVPYEALRNVDAGHDCWQEMKARGDNAPQTAEYFLSCGIHLQRANIARVEGYKNMLQYMAWRETEFLPQRQPMVQFFDTPGNRWAIEQMRSMVNNPDNPVDVLKVNADPETGEGGDDAYDCCRYMLAGRPMKAESMLQHLQRSAWDPDVLKREAEKFRRPQSVPADPRQRSGYFPGAT